MSWSKALIMLTILRTRYLVYWFYIHQHQILRHIAVSILTILHTLTNRFNVTITSFIIKTKQYNNKSERVNWTYKKTRPPVNSFKLRHKVRQCFWHEFRNVTGGAVLFPHTRSRTWLDVGGHHHNISKLVDDRNNFHVILEFLPNATVKVLENWRWVSTFTTSVNTGVQIQAKGPACRLAGWPLDN